MLVPAGARKYWKFEAESLLPRFFRARKNGRPALEKLSLLVELFTEYVGRQGDTVAVVGCSDRWAAMFSSRRLIMRRKIFLFF